MAEAKITKQVKKYLDSFPKHALWYYKVSDKFTSGIPDFIGCYKGNFFVIELKDIGKKPGKLQEWTLKSIVSAGGSVMSTDNFDDVLELFDDLKNISSY